ncbi:MAG: type III restriction-modification system endonuclease [Prevotella fusca]|uniref:type III restriction-modification system endonuclease n=1 Tax=Prevotella fusca TaxID=589436 RepID=UPI003F9F2BF7
MKLKFKHQGFQVEAARNVVRAFQGQPYHDSVDYIMDRGKSQQTEAFKTMGFGNAPLTLDRGDIKENVRSIQMEQGLKPVDHLQGEGVNLTIEMETGTGKTYTYIKTIYELNKHYGWSKFIIVVPSVAIREGVYKSFETMQDHFAHEYGKRMQYFIYNSKQLTKIDNFASDNNLHAMIINTQAFNSSLNEDKNQEGRSGDAAARIIFSKRDEFGSRRPIDILAKTNPVMIIDEPQSVLGANAGNATRKGIKLFNPLAMLLYSATHREVMNMVYRLDAIDAYNKKLVKKIEVKGIRQVGSTATNGFLYLDEIVVSKGKNPQARITYDIMGNTGNVRQTTKLVSEGFDLYEQSGQMAEYRDHYVVERIDGRAGMVKLLNGMVLYEGDSQGEVTEDVMRRIQIRETIKTHIERERTLFPKGIKVLSLFFIDHVENYRTYDDGGNGKGKFAEMFEEEYHRVLQELQPTFTDGAYTRYLSRFSAEQVHNGYFSKDSKGKFINPKTQKELKNGSNDESAYDLIMKDKERLLSFDEPTRFIFSHSALKEGWDNPNVFQICTLKNSVNETNKRQEVGRGMRLCVNKEGERQDADVLGSNVFDTNVLTVIASESYEQFSKQLQHEIADVVSDRPVVITPTLFVDHVYETADGNKVKVTVDDARKIYNQLIKRDYVDDDGKLTDTYFEEKEAETLNFGDQFNDIKEGIAQTLDNVFNPKAVKIDDARKPKEANFQEEQFKKKQFQELWERINVKTYYKVDFETADLILKSIDAIDKHLSVTEIRMVVEEGRMEEIRDKESLEAGTAMVQEKARTYNVRETIGTGVTYDLIGRLVAATGLTRKTIVAILKGLRPATFHQFKMNPEEFIRKVGNIINDEKAMAVVQKICYERTNNTYDVDIFTEDTLRGKIGINAIESTKSLYDLVVVDSEGVEKRFAEALETHDEVAVYTKLPRGFYINTPMGHYNPDWAIAFNEGTVKHIYFVAETKGNEWQRSQLRGAEDAKLECAARHFEAISQSGNVVYGVAKDYKTLYDKVMK